MKAEGAETPARESLRTLSHKSSQLMTPTPLFLFSVSKLAVDYHSVKQYLLSSLVRSNSAAGSPLPGRGDSAGVLIPREGSLQCLLFSVQNPRHRKGSFLFLKYLV